LDPDTPNPANATRIAFSSTINNIGKIKVETFIVEHAGVAGPDSDSLWAVNPGDMKFNVELSEWKFCGHNITCKKHKNSPDTEFGEFVDIEVEVKGKSSKPVNKAKAPKGGRPGKGKKSDFDLGGGIDLKLTNLVDVDGNITEMPEGYPMVETKGKDKTVFTFRIPRFTHKALYDPLITSGEQITGGSTGVQGPGGGDSSTSAGQVTDDAPGPSTMHLLVFGPVFFLLF